MNIVILDGYTVNPGDLSWAPIQGKGETTIYERTAPEQIIARAKGADVLIVNKVRINREHMASLPTLKAICLLATGYDNVDIEAARDRSIRVYNAVGYGTESVAQHTISMMLAFSNRVESHHRSVQNGDWAAQDDFSYTLHTVHELKGKKLGIIGFGKIGGRVGELATVFGMEVMALSRSREKAGAKVVGKDELFRTADFISLHAPLNTETREIVNRGTLGIMKKEAIIINTGRGGLINENDLIAALVTKSIGGAVLDVLSVEPPTASNRLCLLENAWITPHMAWRSYEAREALIQIVAENINRYQHDERINRVV